MLVCYFSFSITSIYADHIISNESNVIEHTVLSNGMEVYLVNTTKTPNILGVIDKDPLVMHGVLCKCGNMDAPLGKTDMAHFVEHMLFKDTDEFKNLLKTLYKNTVINNGTTDFETTAYYELMPLSKLSKIFEIESSRISNVIFREDEIKREKNIVLEEHNMRFRNNPKVMMVYKMISAFFSNSPVGRDRAVLPKELMSITCNEARAFYKKCYTPSNMVLLLVGNIKLEDVKKEIDKYYGKLSYRKANERIAVNESIPVVNQVLSMKHNAVSVPILFKGYGIYKDMFNDYNYHTDVFLTMLSRALAAKHTGWLYKKLVVESKCAVEVDVDFIRSNLHDSMLLISLVPNTGNYN